MGDEQGAEAHVEPDGETDQALNGVDPPGEIRPAGEEGHKQQTQAHAGDDVRIGHGDAVDGHQGPPPALFHVEQAHGGHGPRCRGDHRGQQGHQQGGPQRAGDGPVPDQLLVPAQGKALPHGAAAGVVEGEDDQHEDGRVEKQEDQRHENAVEAAAFPAHSITACSSPSPKRFITAMHTTTMTIITSATAEPR